MSTFDQQISQLKRELGVDSDAQLAQILGYSRANISVWRKRQAVPPNALSRAKALVPDVIRARFAAQKREELGGQVLYEGRCLALFLAPSLDALLGRRLAPTAYSGTLREYASLFDEIELACAEEIAARRAEIQGNATDAFEALTLEDRDDLLARVMERARWWRYGAIQSTTLHEPRQDFRGKEDED